MNTKPDNIEFKLYPNPANQKINIFFNPNGKLFYCSVYDLNGRFLISKILNESNEIDVSNFEDGFYILNVSDQNGFSKKIKFIIAK
jgi:hypothetical protein